MNIIIMLFIDNLVTRCWNTLRQCGAPTDHMTLIISWGAVATIYGNQGRDVYKARQGYSGKLNAWCKGNTLMRTLRFESQSVHFYLNR